MADAIELRGLRVAAIVGTLPEERDRLQPLEIDLVLEVDLAPAGASDELADTVDYGAVCAVAARTAGEGKPALLEGMAESVAQAVLALDPRIESIEVAVRKLRPPVPEQLETAGVRLRRGR